MKQPPLTTEDLERMLRKGGWRHSTAPSDMDLAQWLDSASENDVVEALLAADPLLRRDLVSMRLNRIIPTDEDHQSHLEAVSALQQHLQSPSLTFASVGQWSLAAAATFAIAVSGLYLGSLATESLADGPLSIMTFDLDTADLDHTEWLFAQGDAS